MIVDVEDDFSVATGALYGKLTNTGQQWLVNSGLLYTSGGTLKVVTSPGNPPDALVPVSASWMKVSAEAAAYDTTSGGPWTITARHYNAQNQIRFEIYPTNWNVYAFIGGGPFGGTADTYTRQVGDVYALEVDDGTGDGITSVNITLRINGVVVHTYAYTLPSGWAGSTYKRAGIAGSDVTGSEWAWFKVEVPGGGGGGWTVGST